MEIQNNTDFWKRNLIKGTDLTPEKITPMGIMGVLGGVVSYHVIHHPLFSLLLFGFISTTTYLIIKKDIPNIITISITTIIITLFYLQTEELNSKIDTLNRTIETIDNLNIKYIEDIERLEKTEETLNQINKILYKNLNDSSEMIVKLKEQQKSLMKIIKQKTDSIDVFGQILVQKNKKIEQLNNEIKEKRNRIFILSNKNNYLENKIIHLEKEIIKIKGENTHSIKQQKGKTFYDQALVFKKIGDGEKKNKDKIEYFQKALNLFERAENNNYEKAKEEEEKLRRLIKELRKKTFWSK